MTTNGTTPAAALDALKNEESGYACGGGWASSPLSRQPFRMFADFTGADERFRYSDISAKAGSSEPIMSGSDGAFAPVSADLVVGHGTPVHARGTLDIDWNNVTTVAKPETTIITGDGSGKALPTYEEQRAEQEAAGVAMRFNAGKLRFDLVPPDAFEELVKIFTMGAAKYADRNWEKGFDWMSCLASLKRHLNEFEKGVDHDPESTYLHMAHVMWNAMAITTFQLRGIGKDDRPKLA